MAYLGNAPARNFISFERQVFTIVNSQTAYTLDHSVNNENDIRLVVNNVVQEPGSGKAYTASGTTLTLSAALVNGTDEMYCVFLGRAVATNKPGAGSVGTTELAADAVTEAKIADGAVESEHLNDNVISGQTELASAPASTDELLISDAGTLKRIDVSLVGGDLTPAFSAYVGTTTVLTDATMTTIKYDTENFDTDSAFDTSTYTFTVPSGEGGEYYFSVRMEVEAGGNNRYDNFYIRLVKGSSTIKEIHYYPGGADSPRTNTWELNCTATLAAADTVKVQVYMDFNAGAPQIQAYSSSSEFAGFKILGA